MKYKVGGIMYSCWPYTHDDGRVEVTVDEWVIRSVQKKRNSQSRYGVPVLNPDERRYVNLAQRIEGLTVNKKGEWLKTIPTCCKFQFAENVPPFHLFTTHLQALKFALKNCESDAETRAVKSKITRFRNARAKEKAA
ncbi:hypothetical protein QJS83_14755 [Bdellovibrio sp. 22V]|uniref:hypothetical protein n=1 Tax=Bdellovibrio sp. 22V TaxID=3044166 RepID=UPI002542CDDA|nr:hypothetical protein [Bdellovibrio sp. 22V]WII71723.1 hypothetical protein QJS83_14755 [Bdellovibrio sp. 22V]